MSAMALSPTAVQPAPYFSPNNYTQHQIPADIDLEGGTITHIEEVHKSLKFSILFLLFRAMRLTQLTNAKSTLHDIM
jgi:hypothetical protein